MNFADPAILQAFKEKILAIIAPITPADENTKVNKGFPFFTDRTDAGRKIKDYYLVYFLLVDLLGFKNLGQFEKVAWSVPIDYNGEGFVIEHRKMGVGVFASPNGDKEQEAEVITKKINHAISVATPYFEYRADKAAKGSELNVRNKSKDLLKRYNYFLEQYKIIGNKIKTYETDREAKRKAGKLTGAFDYDLYNHYRWLAMAAIDAFYSWTEHVFILIAILQRKLKTGEAVARMAEEEWAVKFKAALPINDKKIKVFHDDLVNIRQQVRNYVAHGSFGKFGQAFTFHSGAGAVPLLLPHELKKTHFRFNSGQGINDEEAIDIIERFIPILWEGDRAAAKIYIQDAELPLILTMATDGQYEIAMNSEDTMKEFVYYLEGEFDRSADMDF